jgi:hypothetical protein
MQPEKLLWMQYQKFSELSLEAFHASEILVSVVAVMRRFVGVVGAVRSRPAAAVVAPRVIASTSIPASTGAFRKNIFPPPCRNSV